MIASSRNYPFGSKATTIHTDSYTYMVSTAKEGLFKPQSTMVIEMPKGQLDPRRPVAKVIYTPSLRASDRLQMHDVISNALNHSGNDGVSLGEAIDFFFGLLKKRGVVAEAINVASVPASDFLDVLKGMDKL